MRGFLLSDGAPAAHVMSRRRDCALLLGRAGGRGFVYISDARLACTFGDLGSRADLYAV